MEDREQCFRCGEQLDSLSYAVYKEASEDVVGYLCEKCRGSQKIKPLKNASQWKKLEDLKKLLNT